MLTACETSSEVLDTREALQELLSPADAIEMQAMADKALSNLRVFKRRMSLLSSAQTAAATCDHCGEPFVSARSDARYCSPAHRVAAHRARVAARSSGAKGPDSKRNRLRLVKRWTRLFCGSRRLASAPVSSLMCLDRAAIQWRLAAERVPLPEPE